MVSGGDSKDPPDKVRIGFPVDCTYHGGNKALGKHGKHFWIEDGKVGHGELGLTHGIPLGDVASIEVTERSYGGSEVQVLVAPGLPVGRRVRGAAPKQETDIVVWSKDGQQATWVVERRGAAWVRKKLATAMHAAGIPFHEDVLPDRSK
jgi:hypothetical protein